MNFRGHFVAEDLLRKVGNSKITEENVLRRNTFEVHKVTVSKLEKNEK